MNAIPRRQALRSIGLFGGAALAAGCTPAKILLHWYPDEFDSDEALVDQVMGAFADAVVPHDGMSRATAIRAFHDERFPLHEYAGFLASDLCSRAKDVTGSGRFELLGRKDRARVIEDGLNADSTTVKLYSGAIFLTQLTCYAGAYDDEHGCPAIGFEGRYRPRPISERTYRDFEDFLGEEVGINGSYT